MRMHYISLTSLCSCYTSSYVLWKNEIYLTIEIKYSTKGKIKCYAVSRRPERLDLYVDTVKMSLRCRNSNSLFSLCFWACVQL